MKFLYLPFSTLLFCLLFAFSCENNPAKKAIVDTIDKVEKMDFVPSTQDTISLYKFNKWTAEWDMSGLAFSATKMPLSFRMPLVDLTEVMGEAPVATRFHLGLDKSTNTAHLIVVGVDSNNQDMLNYSKGQYAYDVTVPCPDLCPNGGGN